MDGTAKDAVLYAQNLKKLIKTYGLDDFDRKVLGVKNEGFF